MAHDGGTTIPAVATGVSAEGASSGDDIRPDGVRAAARDGLGRASGGRRRVHTMTLLGPTVTVLAVLVGAILGAQTYSPYGADTALGIAFGAASIIAMSLALLLAARPRPLEPFFGGLDRMYAVHKWLGIAALALMIGHNTVEPEIEDFVGETSLGEFASDLGEFAMNGFIGLILVSWFKRIPFTRLELPWPIWRFTHRFTGLLFAIAAFHQLAIDKPAGIDVTLGWYLNTFSAVGVAAWVFTQLVAPLLRRQVHVLDGIERHDSVTEITLRPEGRAMRWRPGQFAFVAAPEDRKSTRLNSSHRLTSRMPSSA
jgi:predicted ferric reductase